MQQVTENLTFLKLYTLLSTVVYIVVNGLLGSGAVVVGSGTNKQVSDKYYTLITPSGWAFAIWSFIFALQALWAIYQVLPYRKEEKAPLIRAFGVFLPIAFHFQTAWPIVFAFEQLVASFIIIVVGWIFLLIAYIRIQREFTSSRRMDALFDGVPTGHGDVFVPLSFSEKAALCFEYGTSRVPTALNLGWVLLASFVNFASLLVFFKKSPGEAVSIFLLSLSGVIAVGITLWKNEPFLPLPLAWGLAAVSSANHTKGINTACYILIGALLVVSFFSFLRTAWAKHSRRNEQQRLLAREETSSYY
jgi:hypothetical protein